MVAREVNDSAGGLTLINSHLPALSIPDSPDAFSHCHTCTALPPLLRRTHDGLDLLTPYSLAKTMAVYKFCSPFRTLRIPFSTSIWQTHWTRQCPFHLSSHGITDWHYRLNVHKADVDLASWAS